MPAVGERPPSYGQADMNTFRPSWLQGVRPAGAATAARNNRNPHFCRYMSSEMGSRRSGEQRPLCQMDGDHLDGRWVQNCDPRLIHRPDHYAYGRALPVVQGWYDYRLCYRQSATERLRALQALSWSWRPKSCALAPIVGGHFDRWLGQRMVLILGDSLSAQTFYSLVWLLGDVVLRHTDTRGVDPSEAGENHTEHSTDSCASSVGNEGGFLSVAHLRSGGKVVKILRHASLVDELYSLGKPGMVWWSSWLLAADVVVLNVGHHYHLVDKGFDKYARFARLAARHLKTAMKPAAHLVFRTTNVGHHACEDASRPLRSRHEAWAQLTDGAREIWAWRTQRGKADLFKDKYSWRGPPLFEGEWRDAAKRGALGDRFAFLNVSFLDLRADGHVATAMRYSATTGSYGSKEKVSFPLDCLHYCYPGPSDYWALSLCTSLREPYCPCQS